MEKKKNAKEKPTEKEIKKPQKSEKWKIHSVR